MELEKDYRTVGEFSVFVNTISGLTPDPTVVEGNLDMSDVNTDIMYSPRVLFVLLLESSD